MANSLLDFVMSLVRDPDAAARYAADPAGAIADAHLTDVTSVDVNNLIPMVADSLSGPLSSTGSGFGPDHGGDGNVWASGAATAAFDAFDAHLPAAPLPETHPVITDLVQRVANEPGLITDPGAESAGLQSALADASAQVSDTVADPAPAVDTALDWVDHAGWEHTHTDDTHGTTDHPGFDLF
ncbi:hypothetical protein B1R94_02780 [Mycolicibacterium litorale]|nr:hypothetical protein B1R94_02780 [Mycolicibacterium litorale]